jgi:hypothetical protein
LTNDGSDVDAKRLEALREPAVAAVHAHMAHLREQRAAVILPKLVAQRDAIEALRDRRLDQLQRKEQAIIDSGRKLRADEAQRFERARHDHPPPSAAAGT